ncbi:MAG: hypothetical protein QNJ75_11860 [Acidimicrobiia bacterium]|nr:hypothetical protein [Acidimicrobiia bacterium]
MTDTKHRELQRRRRAFERKARWNRVWAYRVGSWKHLMVACLEPLRSQPRLPYVIAAATIIGIGGGASLIAGGGLGTGMLVAVGALLVAMAGTGLIRFSRERRSRFHRPPGRGPEQAGVREPRRPPRGGGEMSAALDLDRDEAD